MKVFVSMGEHVPESYVGGSDRSRVLKAPETSNGTEVLLAIHREARWRLAATAAAVAIAYFLATRLGLALLSASSGVAVFWPGAGIAVGTLIIMGRGASPALAIGVVAGTIAASHSGLLASVFKGFCNAGEPIIAVLLLERWFGRPFTFGDLQRVAGFLAAAGLAAAVSATGGAAVITLLDTAWPYWDVWRGWFLSDVIGVVVVAPLVIGLVQMWRAPPSRGEWIEGVGALALFALIVTFVETSPAGSWLSFSPGILLLPPLLWLAARCPPTFPIAGTFVASILVICAITYGMGRFGDANIAIMERVRGAQAAVATGTIFTLGLVALFAQRKKAEDGLQRREAELAEAQRVAHIGSWYWDAHTNVIVGSDELFRIYGFDPATPPADFRAQLDSRYPVDDLERLKAAVRKAMQTGAGYELELRSFRDGTPIWVVTRGEVVRDGGNQITGLRGTVQEITKRKLAELALDERNTQLALAAKAALVGSYAYDVKASMLQFSEGYAAIYDLPEGTSEMMGSQRRSLVHPEDLERLDRVRSEAFGQRRGEFSLEYRNILPKRGVRWIESRSSIFYDSNGRPERLVGVNIDITERKLAELALAERNAQLALAGEAARVGSYAYDVNGGTMQVSAGYAAIHGLPAGTTETSFGEWRTRVHPEDLGRTERSRGQAFADRRQEDNAEYRIVLATGEVRWIERRGFISYSEDGRPERVVGVNIDVTERKRADQHQRTLNAELDHRVKNVLATVGAIIVRTQEASGSPADFVAALERRIASMARTHELLSESSWRGVSLAEISRRELAPYSAHNTDIGGPDVMLKAGAAQAVAMVLHELTTNAAKYGALSNRDGHVSVQWRWLKNGSHARLLFEWRETGGPQIPPPSRSGYGTSIIRELIPFELGGAVDLCFAPEGTRCRLEIPSEWSSSTANGATAPDATTTFAAAPSSP
jgi:PAS domain S-box-containing protein